MATKLNHLPGLQAIVLLLLQQPVHNKRTQRDNYSNNRTFMRRIRGWSETLYLEQATNCLPTSSSASFYLLLLLLLLLVLLPVLNKRETVRRPTTTGYYISSHPSMQPSDSALLLD